MHRFQVHFNHPAKAQRRSVLRKPNRPLWLNSPTTHGARVWKNSQCAPSTSCACPPTLCSMCRVQHLSQAAWGEGEHGEPCTIACLRIVSSCAQACWPAQRPLLHTLSTSKCYRQCGESAPKTERRSDDSRVAPQSLGLAIHQCLDYLLRCSSKMSWNCSIANASSYFSE